MKHGLLITIFLCATTAAADTPPPSHGSETIEIHEKFRPPVIPKPLKSPALVPPYSDNAIETDAWVRSWLVLDIDATGKVQRVKFLDRPGHDLEDIALARALSLRFEPARDSGDRAVPTQMIWLLEWPSYWWLVKRTGFTNLKPDYISHVPCRDNNEPLHLDSVHPVYRDCRPPTMANYDSEKWISPGDKVSPWIDAPRTTWSPSH